MYLTTESGFSVCLFVCLMRHQLIFFAELFGTHTKHRWWHTGESIWNCLPENARFCITFWSSFCGTSLVPVPLSQSLHIQCRCTSSIKIKSPMLPWTQSALEYSQAVLHAVVRYLKNILLQIHLQIPTYFLTLSLYDSYSVRWVKLPGFILQALSPWLLQNFISPL